jgi:hypothetical protein
MLHNSTQPIEIAIKPCNHIKLAKAYGVSNKVLHTHLSNIKYKIGSRKGNNYSLEQLLVIIENIGLPCYLIS